MGQAAAVSMGLRSVRHALARRVAPPDETIEITIVKQNAAAHGFNVWTLNGEAFSPEAMKPMYTLQRGRRYRLKFRNASDDIHPLHLHRHTFELTRVGGKATAGVMKDVVMLGGFQELELDFVADNPGLTLFHCHQQASHGLRLHGAVRLRLIHRFCQT